MPDPAPPTDAQKLKNILIPAAAAAAVIVLVGLVIGLKNPDGEQLVKDAAGNVVDASTAGMVTAMPPLDSPEWMAVGDGLKKWDVKEGDGPAVKAGATVTCHYIGWLTSGKKFDSSADHDGGQPANFSLNGVVAGWTQGLPGMKPGGIRRLYIPYKLAYGANGKPPTIPPAADLVFEVKMISSN